MTAERMRRVRGQKLDAAVTHRAVVRVWGTPSDAPTGGLPERPDMVQVDTAPSSPPVVSQQASQHGLSD